MVAVPRKGEECEELSMYGMNENFIRTKERITTSIKRRAVHSPTRYIYVVSCT